MLRNYNADRYEFETLIGLKRFPHISFQLYLNLPLPNGHKAVLR